MKARVLVTGASGFIGRHAVAALVARGAEVHTITRSGATVVADAHAHAGDLHDAGAFERAVVSSAPTHLLHLAWYVEHGRFWHAPENLTWAARTAGIVRQFAAAGGRRVVGIGTCAEYAHSQTPCGEGSTVVAPTTIYGKAKVASWMLMDAAATVDGLEACWARLFHMFGPAEARGRFVPSIVATLLEGGRAQCLAGRHERDLLHVGDLGDALAAVTLSDVRGAVNVGSGTRRTLGDVARQLARLSGATDRLQVSDADDRPENPRVLVPELERLQHEVGWTAPRSLDERLEETVSWWREQGVKAARP